MNVLIVDQQYAFTLASRKKSLYFPLFKCRYIQVKGNKALLYFKLRYSLTDENFLYWKEKPYILTLQVLITKYSYLLYRRSHILPYLLLQTYIAFDGSMSRIDSVTEHKVEDFQIASSFELCKVRVIGRQKKMKNLVAYFTHFYKKSWQVFDHI